MRSCRLVHYIVIHCSPRRDTFGQDMRSKAHKIDAAFAQERAVLVKKVIELQVVGFAVRVHAEADAVARVFLIKSKRSKCVTFCGGAAASLGAKKAN